MLSSRARSRLSAPSEIRAAFERAAALAKQRGPGQVYNLCIGNPQIPAPPEVAEALEQLLREDAQAPAQAANPHGYMDDAGFPDVRAAVAADLNRRAAEIPYSAWRGAKAREPLAAEHVVMTAGAACALNIALDSLLDPGDEVVVFAPYYPAYRRFIENWGGRMVVVDATAPGFQPDARALARALTPRTKAVVVNSPNNPTGAVYTPETLAALAEALDGTGVVLLSDEPYRDLVFDGGQVPPPGAFYDDTVTIYSFSKALSIPGERIGYAVVPDCAEQAADLRRAMRASLGDLGFVNAPALFQRVAARCLDARVDVAVYERNRDVLVAGLRALGFSAEPPAGGFYLFLKTPCAEEEFLERALSCGLVLVGGGAFGRAGYVRISLCVRPETIDGSLAAFARLAAALGLTPAAHTSAHETHN